MDLELPINSAGEKYPDKHFMDFDFLYEKEAFKIATYRYPSKTKPIKGVVVYLHGLNSHS